MLGASARADLLASASEISGKYPTPVRARDGYAQPGAVLNAIRRAVLAAPPTGLRAKEIAAAVGKNFPAEVATQLATLVGRGELVKLSRGVYAASDHLREAVS